MPRLLDGGFLVPLPGTGELYSPLAEAEVLRAVEIMKKQSAGGSKGAAIRYRPEGANKENRSPIGSSSSSSSLVSMGLNEEPSKSSDDGRVPRAQAAFPPCPVTAIVAAYHEHLPLHQKVTRLTAGRRAQVEARWREVWEKHVAAKGWTKADEPFQHSFAGFFKWVAEVPFLTGKVQSADHPPFFATFDWLMNEEHFWQVREGKYCARR